MATEPETLFGDLLREYRVAAGLTQEALAERAGLSPRGISDLERGARRAPRRDTIRLLAEALQLAGPDRSALVGAARKPAAMAPPDTAEPTSRVEAARLPAPASSFVGRVRELEDVRRLLGTRRLVTLTGPGGCGKTRLAIEALCGAAAEFPDGVYPVDLAAYAGPGREAEAVAAALGLREEPDASPLASLTRALVDRRLVLLLDNCEHMIAGCAALVDALLSACPSLTILATSREALNVAGEERYLVPALALPPKRTPPEPDRLASFDAVRLFVDRAGSVAPGFNLTAGNAAAVARICRRLDGLALAIELAAARVRVLAVEQIEIRLADRFALLGAGSRSAPPRQQALRALIDWSYALLSPAEQTLFRRLAIFTDGCTIEAVEAVCAGEGVAEADVLDLLTQLFDKSLVTTAEEQGEARYRMLETIQLYAVEKLEEADERAGLEPRHSAFYLGLAELARPHAMGVHQAWWLRRLRSDYGNLRAALDRAWRTGDTATGLRLAVAFWRMWDVHGQFSEAAYWLERLLERGGDAPLDLHAQGLAAAGQADLRRGLLGRAGARFEQALELLRELDQREGIADVLLMLGAVAGMQGDYDRALHAFTEALDLYRELDLRQGGASALANVGYALAHQADAAAASVHLEEALALFRDLGNVRGIANVLENLARVAVSSGELVTALERYRESLRLFFQMDDARGMARCLEAIGVVMERCGAPDRARALRAGAALLSATDGAVGQTTPTARRARRRRSRPAP